MFNQLLLARYAECQSVYIARFLYYCGHFRSCPLSTQGHSKLYNISEKWKAGSGVSHAKIVQMPMYQWLHTKLNLTEL